MSETELLKKEYLQKTLLRYAEPQFGKAIKRNRRRLGFSQTKLAVEIGISRTYLSRMEQNLANNLSIGILLRLAKALNLDKYKLLKIYATDRELDTISP